MKPQSSRVLGPGSATRRCGVAEQLKGMASSWKTSWELRPFMSSEDISEEGGLEGMELEIGSYGESAMVGFERVELGKLKFGNWRIFQRVGLWFLF